MRKQTKSKDGVARKSTTEKQAKSLKAYKSEGFKKQEAKLSLDKNDLTSIDETIKAVRDGFGKPHLHVGLGIRDLAGEKHLYECRWAGRNRGGLELRLVFKKLKGKPKALLFDFIGDHREVQRYLKR